MFQLIRSDFTVDRLAQIYVAASPEERERMAAGVERLNAQLRDDPSEVGESRSGSCRVAFHPS